jgi:uncharacterized protein involved in exopolysaccharide biosynthesis/Mrp family chromosome partitioning ATPase
MKKLLEPNTGSLRKSLVVQADFAVEEEALIIDFGQLWLALQSKFKLVMSVSLMTSMVAGLGSFLFYQEKYQSSGTLMLNPTEISRVITDMENNNLFIKEEGQKSSPYKNQEELLKSRLIAQRTLNLLQRQKVKIPYKRPDDLQRDVISARHIKETDFIELTARANSPSLARQIAKAYIDSYMALMVEISNTPLLNKKEFFQAQVAEAELALKKVNEQLQAYQEQYGIVDINVESQDKVRQLIAMDSAAKEIQASLAQKMAESSRIQQQLKLKRNGLESVLQAVALGQDATLASLRQSLQEADKEYQTKSLVYAPSNPEMVQLHRKIEVLKRQIADQSMVNIGDTPSLPSIAIKDPVRTSLVSRLAESESEISALRNKLATIRSQYDRMNHALKAMPKQQLEYARLVLEQKNKENVLIRLKEKLSETQIQKAASGQKLQLIDAPSLPGNPLFPSRVHIILLAAVAGLGLSVLGIAAHTILSKREVRPNWLERMYGIPILASIPWLPEQQWQAFRRRGLLEMTASSVAPELVQAYQNLALNLKVQRNLKGKNALVVSSLRRNSGKSLVLGNLAFCLAQSGENVILLDANFKNPKLHDTFNHKLDYERGLPELINTISEALYRSEQLHAQDLLPLAHRAAIPSEIHPNLHYLNAGLSMENTFEFLNCKGLGSLIQILKSGYDWVLVDAPPFLQAPDAAVLLSYTDALLLIAEAGSDETQILEVQHKIERLNSNIIGVVLRDQVD